MVGTRCVYCEFEITLGNQVYTGYGALAHWQCAAFNDYWEQRTRKQRQAYEYLPDGIAQQIIEAWEAELTEAPVSQ